MLIYFLIIRQEVGKVIDSGNHRHLKSQTWWHKKTDIKILMSIQFLYGRFVILFIDCFPSLRQLDLFLYLLLFHYFNQIIYNDWFGRISNRGICQFIQMHEYVWHKVRDGLHCIRIGQWSALGWIIIGFAFRVAVNFKVHPADNYWWSYRSKIIIDKIMI